MADIAIMNDDYEFLNFSSNPRVFTEQWEGYVSFIACEGLSGITETDTQPQERSYSDGIVFPPNIRRSGRDFTVDILFTNLGESDLNEYSVYIDYNTLENFVKNKTVFVDAVAGASIYSGYAQCQKIEILKDTLEMSRKILLARLYFKGEP